MSLIVARSSVWLLYRAEQEGILLDTWSHHTVLYCLRKRRQLEVVLLFIVACV